MKQSILLIPLLLCLSCSSADKKIKGNGKMTTITRTTSTYDGIACAGSFDYALLAGTEGRITLEGEENLLEYIITEVKDDKLIIKTAKNINLKPSRNKMIKITIPFKDISNVSLAGSGDLWSTDVINATHFKVALAGSGDVVLNVENSTTEGSIAGSGDLTLKGNTNQLIAKVAGSGDIKYRGNPKIEDFKVAGSGSIGN